MVARWVRLMVACTAALVAWLVVTPAYASAPLCDPRGATAIAPAPQLQAPTTSIDATAPDDEGFACSESAMATRTANDGQPQTPAAPDVSSDSALPMPAPAVFVSPFASGRASRDTVRGARNGEITRVDRPPRG